MFQESKKTELGFAAEGMFKTLLSNSIKVPNAIRDEIPTLNRTGYMKLDFSKYCKEFIEYAASIKDYAMEIGCAYGLTAREALKAGGKIIASDLSKEHLEILVKEAPQDKLTHLYLYPGAFPSDIDLPKESIGAVLTARILHFLRGEEIEEGLTKIHKWLIPGGKFFFTAASVYNEVYCNAFLPLYRDNVQRGKEWPGEIEDFHSIAPEHKEYVGPFLHVFSEDQLKKILPKYGFEIEKISLFNYPNDTTGGDKGHIGFVARKA